MPRKAKKEKEKEEVEDEVWSEKNDEDEESGEESGSDYEEELTKKATRKKATQLVKKKRTPSLKKKSASCSSNVSSTSMTVNSEYMENIKQVFNRFDTENIGKIETSKLKFAMRALGFEPKSEEVKRISEDYDNDGFISYQDFIDLLVKRFTEKNVNEEIMKAFQLFDKEQTGKITITDLQRVSDELGEKISPEELKEMIEEADLNNDSVVDAQEFLRIMKKTSLY